MSFDSAMRARAAARDVRSAAVRAERAARAALVTAARSRWVLAIYSMPAAEVIELLPGLDKLLCPAGGVGRLPPIGD